MLRISRDDYCPHTGRSYDVDEFRKMRPCTFLCTIPKIRVIQDSTNISVYQASPACKFGASARTRRWYLERLLGKVRTTRPQSTWVLDSRAFRKHVSECYPSTSHAVTKLIQRASTSSLEKARARYKQLGRCESKLAECPQVYRGREKCYTRPTTQPELNVHATYIGHM
jgi:hypothetical protein